MIDPVEKKKTNHVLDGTVEETNLEIGDKAEYVPLPSQGVFYKGQYQGMKQLLIRNLNWEDEDILTTESYYHNNTLFNELLKRCIVDKNGFKPEWLVPVDRDAILYWLRIGAFGPEYELKRTNPRDEDESRKIVYDLSELEMPEFNPEYAEELMANGEVETLLPDLQVKVKITVASIGREQQVAEVLKKKKQKTKSKNDFLITGKLMSVLCEVPDGEGKPSRDPVVIGQFLSNRLRSLKDSRHILKVAKAIDLKISHKIDVEWELPSPWTEKGVEMPMSIYFFWPEFDELS